MSSLSKLAVATIMTLSAGSLAVAQDRGHNAHHASSSTPVHNNTASASAARTEGAMSEGVVRKVDRSTNKVTIRHGELANLGMPPMTMVFRVTDLGMLDQVKTGDKINFVAEKIGGQFTVTQMQVQQ